MYVAHLCRASPCVCATTLTVFYPRRDDASMLYSGGAGASKHRSVSAMSTQTTKGAMTMLDCFPAYLLIYLVSQLTTLHVAIILTTPAKLSSQLLSVPLCTTIVILVAHPASIPSDPPIPVHFMFPSYSPVVYFVILHSFFRRKYHGWRKRCDGRQARHGCRTRILH